MGGQWYDGNISIPGCDKNMPGTIMAMARINRPSLMVSAYLPDWAGLYSYCDFCYATDMK
jgi:hypothetical protein